MSTTSDNLEELPGVGPATADSLLDNGFDSYQKIAAASPSELTNQTKVGDSKASDVIQAAREEADLDGFESGKDVYERRMEIGKLTTKIPQIDDAMAGGLETQSITEVYGEFGAGKSQVSHHLSVTTQLPEEHGGLEKGVIFIDTEDTFRPERIEDVVRGFDDDVTADFLDLHGIDGTPDDEQAMSELVDAVLDQIHVAKAFNSDHQILLAEKAVELAGEHEETDWPIGLVAVDSLTAHFRAEYVGRGELAERQQKLNKHIHDLMRIGDIYNTAIVVTNQVASNPDSYFGDPTQAIGGNIIGHACTYRIYLRKSKNNKRIWKIIDAPNLAEKEAVFRVTDDGLDPE